MDSPDILFKDLTDWSAVELNGAAAYRFNDRDIIRAFADNNVFAYDFLVSHGLDFYEAGARLWRHDQRGQVGAQGHARGRHGIPADSDRQTGGGLASRKPLPGASASCARWRQPRGKRACKFFLNTG